MIVRVTLLMLVASGAVGCKSPRTGTESATSGAASARLAPPAASSAAAGPSVASSSATASAQPAEEREPPFHAKPMGSEHAAPRGAPPPRAKRAGKAKVRNEGKVTLTTSDLSIAVGKEGAASIEVVPTGEWKINTEYPARVTLSGMTVAVTPKMTLKSSDKKVSGFQITDGGMRLDIPFTGDAPGSDTVSARLRVGICNPTTCEGLDLELDWRVTVTEK